MARKRVAGELEAWASLRDPDYKASGAGRFVAQWADESRFWTVERDVRDDFRLNATLRPSKGPFRGLSWTMQLQLPSNYPFSEPKVSPGAIGPCPGGTYFHPCLNTAGLMCQCGIKDTWSPAASFAMVLAFFRVGVESLDLQEQKPVPAGSDRCMCFCTLNPAAAEALKTDVNMFCVRARLAAHGSNVMPLNISISTQAADDHVSESVCLNFTSMGGNLVGQFERFPIDVRLGNLYHRVMEELSPPGPNFTWSLVLPDGQLADLSNIDTPLATALNIPAQSEGDP